MNKKLKPLLWPGLWVYFLIMAGFVAAAVLTENYILAAAEGGVTALLMMYYVLCRNRRRKDIQSFVKAHFNVYEADTRADTPYPLVLERIE